MEKYYSSLERVEMLCMNFIAIPFKDMLNKKPK